MHLHPALLDAASQIRLNKNGRFPVNILIRQAAENEAGPYADWEWP